MTGIEHFIRLARTGKNNPGASGGEKRAFRLAQCVLNNVPGLDGEAIEGLIEFIRIVQPYPQEAHDLIEQPSPLGRRVTA